MDTTNEEKENLAEALSFHFTEIEARLDLLTTRVANIGMDIARLQCTSGKQGNPWNPASQPLPSKEDFELVTINGVTMPKIAMDKNNPNSFYNLMNLGDETSIQKKLMESLMNLLGKSAASKFAKSNGIDVSPDKVLNEQEIKEVKEYFNKFIESLDSLVHDQEKWVYKIL